MKRTTKKIVQALIITFLITLIFINFNSNKSINLTPSGIRLNLTRNSSDSIVITWFTLDEAKQPVIIYYEENTRNFKEAEPVIKKLPNGFMYQCKIENLKPNTRYYYQICSDYVNERETMSFVTFPDEITKLKFLVISDSQLEGEGKLGKIIDIVKEKEYDFFIHCGDVVSYGKNPEEWERYFKITEPLASKIPGFYIEGSHDESAENLMYSLIPMISSSYHYEFDDFLSILGINTRTKPSDDWIENKLKDTKTTWKITFMHDPIFDSKVNGEDHDEEWTNLFERYYVDSVFSGSQHIYEKQRVNGIYYLICPPSGPEARNLNKFEAKSFTREMKKVNGFIEVSVDLNELDITVFGIDEDGKNAFKIDEIKIKNS